MEKEWRRWDLTGYGGIETVRRRDRSWRWRRGSDLFAYRVERERECVEQRGFNLVLQKKNAKSSSRRTQYPLSLYAYSCSYS